MTYSPLCTVAQFQASPYNDLIRDMASSTYTNLMVQSSRAVEAYCNRRLTPFTGLVESHRAQNIDPVESTNVLLSPLDQTAMLGMSRANSLGSGDLVREFWLREAPPRWPDLWSGSITSIQTYPAFSGSQTISNSSQWQYEVDQGHVRVALGTFAPQGTTLVTTYSGGYASSTYPDDLNLACMFEAAKFALLLLAPEARPNIDTNELDQERNRLLKPYLRGD